MLATVRGDIDVQREEWIGDAAYYGAHVREALEKSARQRQRAAEMARKTFGRRWTVSVFGRWRDVTVERRRRRVAANRAMGRIMHLRVASPFHSWIAKVRDSRRARRALSKMSERRASNRTARAWAAWSRAAVVGRRSRRHDGLVELLRRRAATKMRRRDVSRAFSGWTAKVSEVRRMRAVGTKIAERWMRSSMADFFFAWFQLSRGKCRRRGVSPRSSFASSSGSDTPRSSRGRERSNASSASDISCGSSARVWRRERSVRASPRGPPRAALARRSDDA